MNDPLIRRARPSRATPEGALRAAVCEFMRSMLSRGVVALNRDAFVLNESADTTVDLDGHRASSGLDGLELDEPTTTPRNHSRHSFSRPVPASARAGVD